MTVDNTFKFTVNISLDGYGTKQEAVDSAKTEKLASKYGHKYKMSFVEKTVDIATFDDYIFKGYSYCGGLFRLDPHFTERFESKGHTYTTTPYYKNKEKSLKMQFKADRFFTAGQVVSIDIDGTRFNDPEKYIDALSLKPTYAYTSFSDDPNGLRKFRLVYVMDSLLGRDDYEYTTKAIHRQAEKDTIDPVKDNCGERFSQFFNGTHQDAQSWVSYNIYSLSDIMPIVEREGIELDEKPEKKNLFEPSLVADMCNLSYDKFMHFYSWKYGYFWNSLDFSDGAEYKAIDPAKDVVLLFRWKGNGEIDKFTDGEGRRKHIQKYAALRRLAKPEITPDELLFNLYVDRERFFDNSDDAITIECLQRKVEIAFDMTIDELRIKYQSILDNCPTKFVLNPELPEYRKQAVINKAKKETGWGKIASLYDATKSVKENLELLKNAGVKVEKTTLYEYCKENGLATNPNAKDTRKARQEKKDAKGKRNSQILSLYDKSKSLRENLKVLVANGIDISKKTLSRIIAEGDSLESASA